MIKEEKMSPRTARTAALNVGSMAAHQRFIKNLGDPPNSY